MNVRLLSAIATTCVLAGAAGIVFGQEPRAADAGAPTLNALLTEVRGIRAELNQAASASLRAQLLVARLQLQEQRINVVSAQLAEARRLVLPQEAKESEKAMELKRFEGFGAEPGSLFSSDERQAIAERIPQLKEELAQIRGHLLRLRAQETEFADLLASEQTRWVEFNSRLDELERSLPVR